MVVVANTFLIGIVLMAIGLVALYIGNIHTEVINRPLYIIRERISHQAHAVSTDKIQLRRLRVAASGS